MMIFFLSFPTGAIKLALVLDALALCGFVLFLVLGCDNVKMAGATFPYHAYVNRYKMKKFKICILLDNC